MTTPQGLDVLDLSMVVLYGVPQNIIQFRQKKGCMGHTPGMNSICLIIVEAWACGTVAAKVLAGHKPGTKEK
jgi:hypothetical protein